jgi:hypothetical protein
MELRPSNYCSTPADEGLNRIYRKIMTLSTNWVRRRYADSIGE